MKNIFGIVAFDMWAAKWAILNISSQNNTADWSEISRTFRRFWLPLWKLTSWPQLTRHAVRSRLRIGTRTASINMDTVVINWDPKETRKLLVFNFATYFVDMVISFGTIVKRIFGNLNPQHPGSPRCMWAQKHGSGPLRCSICRKTEMYTISYRNHSDQCFNEFSLNN